MKDAILGITLGAHALLMQNHNTGIHANLRYAYLRGADLRSADLRYADLRGADLRDADLRGADLRDADLNSANLRYANLRGANLRYANRIIGPQRSDGYLFSYCKEQQIIHAGCQHLSIAAFKKRANNYSDSAKKIETLNIIAYLEAMAAVEV